MTENLLVKRTLKSKKKIITSFSIFEYHRDNLMKMTKATQNDRSHIVNVALDLYFNQPEVKQFLKGK
jgi:hypothetical protein